VTNAKVTSLSEFVATVRKVRESWRTPAHRELWFRGESRLHDTLLRPELFRPRSNLPLKPTAELLKIENDLYEDFRRCATQFSTETIPDEDWDWDSYFLMQHHGGPTRLLDWSDGALMALHFALRNKKDERSNAVVYVMEPYRLKERIMAESEIEIVKTRWRTYVTSHPSQELDEDDWDRTYLPSDDEDLAELPIPVVPLLLDFPHITRRVAAQRSRFMVFGTAPAWLSAELEKPDSSIRAIPIDGACSYQIRLELRDSGVTESVIFPDLDGLGRELRQLWDDRK
jgi:hypothetical protein